MSDSQKSAAPSQTIVQIARRFSYEEWGGTESVIQHTSEEFVRRGYAVKLLTSDLLARPGTECRNGVGIRRFRGFYPRFGLSKAAKKQLSLRGGDYFCPGIFFTVLFTRNLHAVHLHTGGFIGALGRLAARLRRRPCVMSIHGGRLDLPPEQMAQLLAPLKGSLNWGRVLEFLLRSRRLDSDVDTLICLAESERERLQAKYPGTRVVTLPNGVDVRRFSSGDGEEFRRSHGLGDAPVLLAVGGFYEQKNQLTLLEAFAMLKSRGFADARLVMIGVVYDREYFDRLAEFAKSRLPEGDVLFLCNLDYRSPELAGAYRAADCFVHPSRYETFGIVILEAFAASCPVVCGCVGGIRDYGEDGRNLLFADIGSAGSIAAAAARILGDPELARRLAESGGETAASYSWETIAGTLLEYYEYRK